ncbi:hypothetical protein CTAYLR_010679 [Chrysophaeum taylorii]|uniref:Uncharacterized protein n=1 Tax=Chrysophaeum taylorii TaxID=2483200 RepID=A0AAD7XLD2_9STRA|nr:hypothetical protein CTAYLR_010679 [Chrysophaeum taylorii]
MRLRYDEGSERVSDESIPRQRGETERRRRGAKRKVSAPRAKRRAPAQHEGCLRMALVACAMSSVGAVLVVLATRIEVSQSPSMPKQREVAKTTRTLRGGSSSPSSSWPPNATRSCSPELWLNGTDLKGMDLPAGYVSLSTSSECCGACVRRTECVAWTAVAGGGCWLKGAKPGKSLKNEKLTSGVIVGRKPSPLTMRSRRPPQKVAMDEKTMLRDFAFMPREVRRLKKAEVECGCGASDPVDELALHASTPARDWSEAFPVGNGAMGALVGFEARAARVPLAEETLFESRAIVEAETRREREAAAKLRAERRKKGRLTPDDRQWDRKPNATSEAFSEARRALLDGDLGTAHEMSRWLDEGPVASFEGLATLEILAGDRPLELANYERSLDLRVGIASAKFEARPPNGSEIYAHRREAFFSAADNVLVLRYECAEKRHRACASVSVGLRRSERAEVVKVDGDTLVLKSSGDSDLASFAACARIVEDNDDDDTEGHRTTDRRQEEETTTSLRRFFFPKPKPKVESSSSDEKPPSPKAIAATNERGALVVLVAGATSYRNGSKPPDAECAARLERASHLTYRELRRRHAMDFAEHFGKTKLSLAESNGLRPKLSGCSPGSVRDTAKRVEALAQTCARNESKAREPAAEARVVDPSLLALAYNYARYLLLSSSRGGDGLPANLQGVWADGLKAPWAGDYHLNINLEMAYWGAMTANLQRSAEPLFSFVDKLAARGRETAKEWYGIDDGWVAHGFTDVSGDARALGENRWALCVTCGAWVALGTYEASEVVPTNRTLLARAMLQLEGAVRFFARYLAPYNDTNGEEVLVTGPTTSPENSYRYRVKNATAKQRTSAWGTIALAPAIDVAILARIFEAYHEGCARLLATRVVVANDDDDDDVDATSTNFSACDSEVVSAALDASERLPNGGWPKVCEDGVTLREYPLNGDAKDCIPDQGHRHFSGLWALMPGRQISPIDTKGLALKAKATLRRKLSAGGGHTGWSRAWTAALAARLHDGDAVEAHLLELVSEYFAPNLLATHPRLKPNDRLKDQGCTTCFERDDPTVDAAGRLARLRRQVINRPRDDGMITTTGDVFQIDGNLGLVAAVNEALVQAHRGPLSRVELHLLPALPPSWTHGSLFAVKLRGGFELDIRWKNNKLTNLTLKVIDPFGSSVAIRAHTELTIVDFHYKFSVARGEDSRRLPMLFTPKPGITVVKPIFADYTIYMVPLDDRERGAIDQLRDARDNPSPSVSSEWARV